jgi:kynureninase
MSLQAEIDALADRLRPHYSRFLEAAGGEVLLTGHSHQAWPDVSREGQLAAWDDAAKLVDRKWTRIFGEILPEFQRRVAARIGTSRALDIAYGQNTHELVVRLASALPRSGVVTTDSEFHSIERQLDRWSEGGLRVVRLAVEDEQRSAETFAERFIKAVDRERPSWAYLSYVLFTNARIIADLPAILDELARMSIPVIVDVYHAFNALDFEADAWRGDVHVVGGGYKYAECGEGACFMLLSERGGALRPLETGWFSHFESLETRRHGRHAVEYGSGGLRFLGATFDPTSLYRAVWVLRFMDEQGLSPRVLREQSLKQTALILEAFDALHLETLGLELDTPRSPRGGFVAITAKGRARALSDALASRGVRSDWRGDRLRLGPAPYVRSHEISRAMEILASLARGNAP